MNLPFAVVLPGLGEVRSFDEVGKKYQDWLGTQEVAVQVLLTGLQSAVQGGVLGYMFGSISAIDPTQNGAAKQANPALDNMMKAGPWGSARNLAALTGVQAAATLAIKKARNGKEDVYSA
jgi:hypothetical protein